MTTEPPWLPVAPKTVMSFDMADGYRWWGDWNGLFAVTMTIWRPGQLGWSCGLLARFRASREVEVCFCIVWKSSSHA